MTQGEYDEYWTRFDELFGFRPGVDPSSWPAITEPLPSITFDLRVIRDGPQLAAAYDAINAEALRSFVFALAGVPDLVVLNWQHSAYRFRPAAQALKWNKKSEWKVPVYPNGDYYVFLTPDYSHGTFGHPWEKTLCVFGTPLIGSLGRSLSTWLPTKRTSGRPS